MSQATPPDQDVIDAEYIKQNKQRYLVIENAAIDDAFGTYDYDADMWVLDPYHSERSASSMAMSKNKGAKRL